MKRRPIFSCTLTNHKLAGRNLFCSPVGYQLAQNRTVHINLHRRISCLIGAAIGDSLKTFQSAV
jgi:hypothetical protein